MKWIEVMSKGLSKAHSEWKALRGGNRLPKIGAYNEFIQYYTPEDEVEFSLVMRPPRFDPVIRELSPVFSTIYPDLEPRKPLSLLKSPVDRASLAQPIQWVIKNVQPDCRRVNIPIGTKMPVLDRRQEAPGKGMDEFLGGRRLVDRAGGMRVGYGVSLVPIVKRPDVFEMLLLPFADNNDVVCLVHSVINFNVKLCNART
jgi:hypothetical protein